MIDIMVVNCDDVFVEYQWVSAPAFLSAMSSNKENIPMLDDVVITMGIGDRTYNEEMLRLMGIYDVSDVVTYCESKVRGFL